MLTVREQARNRVIALRLQALGMGTLGWEEPDEGADPIPRNFSDTAVLVNTVDDWCAFRGASPSEALLQAWLEALGLSAERKP